MLAKLQQTADRLAKDLLYKLGGVGYYITIIAGYEDDDTGDWVDATATETKVSLAPVKTTAEELNSKTVLSTQKVFLMEAKAISTIPNASDKVKMNNITYKVVKGLDFSGGQTTSYYRLVCEK